MKIENRLAVAENFRVMGTEVQVEIILKAEAERAKGEESLKRSREIFAVQEKIFSRFDPESELSRLNQKLNQEVAVSDPMAEVLALCLKFNQMTQGYFDPRVLENLEKIGYDRDFRSQNPNDPEEAPLVLEKIETDLAAELKLDQEKKTVWITRRIDTTGIVKGYAVDQVAQELKREGWDNFLVDAGGDMFGSGQEAEGKGWLVGVEGLEHGTVRIRLEDEGIATSGISRKRWTRGGRKFHHLINPQDPQEFSHELKTVTVVAEKTVEADGRAKTLFLMGKEAGLNFANQEKIKVLFLDYKNNVYVSEKFKENLA